MEVVADLTKAFYELFPHAPRTNMFAEDVKELHIHTGHVFRGENEVVVTSIAGESPTNEELHEFCMRFEEVRAGRAVYSFVGPSMSLVKKDERFGLISMPVLIIKAQLTPTVIYRGENNLGVPSYATKNSIGFDIKADAEVVVPANGRKLVKTGLFLDAHDWDNGSPCYLRLAPKSGLALKKGIDVLAGVVDPDYPEEIGVVLMNHSQEDQTFKIGDAVAQGIWEIAVQGGNLPAAVANRVSGFGSTNQ